MSNKTDTAHAMTLAWGRIKKAQSKAWGDWMTIGEGLLEGRRWAMQTAGVNTPEGKGYVLAFGEWLKRYKVDDMHAADRAKLLQLMEERPAVEEWRATLPANQRRDLNNPTTVWRKWTAATKVKKPKPRSAGASAAEMGRARHTVEQLQARNLELEEELTTARQTISTIAALAVLLAEIKAGGMLGISDEELEALDCDAADLAELEKRIHDLRLKKRRTKIKGRLASLDAPPEQPAD